MRTCHKENHVALINALIDKYSVLSMVYALMQLEKEERYELCSLIRDCINEYHVKIKRSVLSINDCKATVEAALENKTFAVFLRDKSHKVKKKIEEEIGTKV